MVLPWQHDVASAGSRLLPWDRGEKRKKFMHVSCCYRIYLQVGNCCPGTKKRREGEEVCACVQSLTTIAIYSRGVSLAKVLAFEFH